MTENTTQPPKKRGRPRKIPRGTPENMLVINTPIPNSNTVVSVSSSGAEWVAYSSAGVQFFDKDGKIVTPVPGQFIPLNITERPSPFCDI